MEKSGEEKWGGKVDGVVVQGEREREREGGARLLIFFLFSNEDKKE